MKYDVETPILYLILDFGESTIYTFKQISKIQPKKFYYSVLNDMSLKDIPLKIRWECHSELLFYAKKDENVSELARKSISKFFELEKEGVVLHSNCVPNKDFWGFCSMLLKKYRYDERISQICGTNIQTDKIGNADYYFSCLTQTFAFASWRRVWREINGAFDNFNEDDCYLSESQLRFKPLWKQYFQMASCLSPKVWNLNLLYNNIVNHKLSVIPNVNLIKGTNLNIYYPFRKELRNDKTNGLKKELLIHPKEVFPSVKSDIQTQLYEFEMTRKKTDFDAILFLEEKLKKVQNRKMKIPKIIHQIYVCKDSQGKIPEDLLELSKTWRSLHPDWEYRFWDKESIDDFLREYYPDFIPYYYEFPYDVQRWDSIRYLILYHFGGLYVDMDYECIEPIDSLLDDSTCCMGLEPSEHAIENRKNIILGNALMASVPRHPYFDTIIKTIKQGEMRRFPNKALQVMETTGPFMLTRMYENYPNKDEITLLPAELIAPLCITEIQDFLQDKITEEMELKVERAFAIHYFGGSWHSQTSE